MATGGEFVFPGSECRTTHRLDGLAVFWQVLAAVEIIQVNVSLLLATTARKNKA